VKLNLDLAFGRLVLDGNIWGLDDDAFSQQNRSFIYVRNT
jgi:hypothetical protein